MYCWLILKLQNVGVKKIYCWLILKLQNVGFQNGDQLNLGASNNLA